MSIHPRAARAWFDHCWSKVQPTSSDALIVTYRPIG